MRAQRRNKEYSDAYPSDWSLGGDRTPRPKDNATLSIDISNPSLGQSNQGSATPTQKTAFLKGGPLASSMKSPLKEYTESYPSAWSVASPPVSQSPVAAASAQVDDEIKISKKAQKRQRSHLDQTAAQDDERDDGVTARELRRSSRPTQHAHGTTSSTWSEPVWSEEFLAYYRMLFDQMGGLILDEHGLAIVAWSDNITNEPTTHGPPGRPLSSYGALARTSPFSHAARETSPPFPLPPLGYSSSISPHVSGQAYSSNAPQYYPNIKGYNSTVSPNAVNSASSAHYSAQAYSMTPQAADGTTISPWSVISATYSVTSVQSTSPKLHSATNPSPYNSRSTRTNMGAYVPAPAGYDYVSPPVPRLSSTLPTSADYPYSNGYANFKPATFEAPVSGSDRMRPRPSRIDLASASTNDLEEHWMQPPAPTENKKPWSEEAPQWVGLD